MTLTRFRGRGAASLDGSAEAAGQREPHATTQEEAEMTPDRVLVSALAALLLGCVSIESSPIAGNDEEKRILDVLEEMAERQGRGKHNVSREDGRLLRLLTEATDAKHVVEIGTANGYSGIWFCLALRTTGGRLTTHEIDAELAALARENFSRAGVEQMATVVEGDAHQEVTRLQEPIDILFLDADKSGYLDYLEKLLPRLRAGGLVVAHNMQPMMADPKYVEAITSDPSLETVFLNKSLWGGMGVTLKKRDDGSPSGEVAPAIGP
jgi:predicted O-methyltransferase YrrM